MNTMFLLMAEFEISTILLYSISERYLGMKPSTADKKASAADLPIPTFRMGNTQKAPRMIHVNDLAAVIDKRRKEAKKEFEHCK